MELKLESLIHNLTKTKYINNGIFFSFGYNVKVLNISYQI